MSDKIKRLPIIDDDEWLLPVADKINERYNNYTNRLNEIENSCGSLLNYANGHYYYGLTYNKIEKKWYYREWLPAAKDVYIFGDFNHWQRTSLPLTKDEKGIWSISFDDEIWSDRFINGCRYKILVHGDNGWHERLPAYVNYVTENHENHDFAAQLYISDNDPLKYDSFDISSLGPLLIYEAHIGMAQQEFKIGSYIEFAEKILTRIKKSGYNTIQLMAIAEHPYYGSFGYHVSNLFAPSSRFGTPDELKILIKKAHNMGIGVIMDLVHSHYVSNFNEGLNELDGSNHHYSKAGSEGDHPYWGSKNFDYSKQEVEHFLLSNIKYWMENFHFDGFRFDGVTSMLYKHHGYIDFLDREDYFNDSVNLDALRYLTLANKLIHDINPSAISIAEDVSGMPGICYPIDKGGIGFDYRLGMSTPDYWIKLLKDVPDEDWNIEQMWYQMTNRLPSCKTIAYAESHDQALVGDKTIAFRLMDKEMYTNMSKNSKSIVVDRGIALHKMIRFFTICTAGDAYLNFMGNEFGHPEWIDFPRPENGYSYNNAHRDWILADNKLLRYDYLQRFDKDMLHFVKRHNILNSGYPYNLNMDKDNKTIIFEKSGLIFIFNWHPNNSIFNYEADVIEHGKYSLIFNSDDIIYGGFGRINPDIEYFSQEDNEKKYISIYNINRSVLVFKRDN